MLKNLPVFGFSNHLKFSVICLALAIVFLAVPFRSTKVEAQLEPQNPSVPLFSENFDGVAAPNLPAGWTTTTTGQNLQFITGVGTAVSTPNHVATNNPSTAGSSQLTSPPITVGSNLSRLIFQHSYQTEIDPGFDGGVLEISIAGGAFQDVLAAGGNFVSGSYIRDIRADATGNPLIGRQAWTGSSPGYITTEVNLPSSVLNQSVRFRWRYGTDQQRGGNLWRIDNIQVTDNSVAQQIAGYTENFDNVTAPALPANWTTAITGMGATPFVTATLTPDTPPNAVFTNNPPSVSTAELVSPVIRIGGSSPKVIFRHHYDMENNFDGGVLEIKINSGNFQDIIAAGGSFVSGGYNGTLNTGFGNPLPGRQAWTNNSNGYVTTEVNIPPAAHRQSVQFRWLRGTDNVVGDVGWRIDSVRVTNAISGENSSAISIPSSGIAEPYPSQIEIINHTGLVTGVQVNLTNFSHFAPDDVDLMLVAPNNRKVVLMSDVGGANPVSNLSISFDDAATAALPDNAPFVSGNFKPTDFKPGDPFPAPAPGGELSGNRLSAFGGSEPNGAWKLFLVDDNGENVGVVASWSLTLTASASACTFSLTPTGQGFPITGGSGSFTVNMPTGCPWTASTNSNFVSITSNASGEGLGTVNYTVAPNMNAGRTASIVVSNGVFSQTFLIQQPSGCPFSLNNNVQNVSASSGARNVAVTAGASCAYLATSNVPWIQITSPTQTGDGAVNFTVAPNPSETLRSATITIGARTLTVNQAGSLARGFDFDGDGRADVSIYRPANGTWYIQNSQNNSLSAAQFGVAADRLVPADYDGDRKTDYAVFRDGVWYILQSQTNTVRSVGWGLGTDIPTPGDYDGDGKSDPAVYRAGEGNWYVLRSGSNTSQAVTFGAASDQPVPADYDGDGRTDFAVYRAGASSGWFVLQSGSNSVSSRAFGTSGDVAAAGDYDGDGRDNYAVFRPSTGTWYLAAANGSGFEARQFGQAGDVPVAADYNGDGRTDIGVFRAGAWYILLLGSETFRTVQWGLADDRAVPAAFNRQ
jgi:hypothetical protein